jgi:hypothetical protein
VLAVKAQPYRLTVNFCHGDEEVSLAQTGSGCCHSLQLEPLALEENCRLDPNTRGKCLKGIGTPLIRIS